MRPTQVKNLIPLMFSWPFCMVGTDTSPALCPGANLGRSIPARGGNTSLPPGTMAQNKLFSSTGKKRSWNNIKLEWRAELIMSSISALGRIAQMKGNKPLLWAEPAPGWWGALLPPKSLAKGFFSPLEVRWLFKRGEEDDSKHMFCFLLAALWDFAPPVYSWFLICFHTSLAVPKSRNKRAEVQKKCRHQEQHSPPTGFTFSLVVFFFFLMSLCWVGLHVMRESIGLIFLFLLSHCILWFPAFPSNVSQTLFSHQMELFSFCAWGGSVCAPSRVYWKKKKKKRFLKQIPCCFQSFGVTRLSRCLLTSW